MVAVAAVPSGLVAEGMISMPQAAALFPQRHHKKVHVVTIIRYITVGWAGVKLEGKRTPGGWVTSVAAVQRFIDAVDEECRRAAKLHAEDEATATPRPTQRRNRVATAAQQAAAKELDALGIV